MANCLLLGGGGGESWITSIPTMHRNIFRGKYLGDHVTAAQFAAVVDNSFDDLYVGDYWTIPVTIDGTEISVNWRIADMNYSLKRGVPALNVPHLTIVPDTILYTAKMNDTDTAENGYAASKMHTTYLNKARTAINTAFPGMVLEHNIYLTDATASNSDFLIYPTSVSHYNVTGELMSEIMLYGHNIFGFGRSASDFAGALYFSDENTQFALFRMAPEFIVSDERYWQRDIVTHTSFPVVAPSGTATLYVASAELGVRPYFLIGAAE